MSSTNNFVYVPTMQDVDNYIKFKNGEIKYRLFMKDYKSLHGVQGLSDSSILVYEAIRNLFGIYVNQLNFKEKFKKPKGLGTVRNNSKTISVVGATMIITNPMLQEWIGNKSHHTIKLALEQLEDFGFIKCSVDGVNKKSGRKITLLRDMEEYQPEEILALEEYVRKLESESDRSKNDVSKNENEKEKNVKPSRKKNSKNKNIKNKETNGQTACKTDKETACKTDKLEEADEFDGFEF